MQKRKELKMTTCHEGLKRIIAEKGLSITENGKLLKAMMIDFCPDAKREIQLILSSLDIGIVEQLQSVQEDTCDLTIARVIQQCMTDLGIMETYARWVVEVWLDVLSIKETANPLPLPESEAAPAAPARSISTQQQNILVSPFGQADYRSISQALENGREGVSILVKPGLYKESLVLAYPVQIMGEGNPDAIIIESSDGDCVRMAAEYGQLRGLTFHQKSEGAYFAINVPQGHLLIENCNITSESMSCVAVEGDGTSIEMHKCRVHDSQRLGISFGTNAAGVVEDCDIYANKQEGVYIRGQANPIFRRCKIHDGKVGGIFFDENGLGVFEECDIFANTFSSVVIKDQSNPVFRRCKIHDGKEGGIFADINGLGH